MEITNDNYKVLHKSTLNYNDIVKFVYNNITYEYRVEADFLQSTNSKWYNDIIFDVLQLNRKHMTIEAYGYPYRGGDWPVCRHSDYAALTRLVIFLFEEIEKRENPKAFTKSILSNSIKIKINIESQIKLKLK